MNKSSVTECLSLGTKGTQLPLLDLQELLGAQPPCECDSF